MDLAFPTFGLCERRDCRDRNVLPLLNDAWFARQWLTRHLHDPGNLTLLRRLVFAQGSHHLRLVTNEDAVREGAELLARGWVHVHVPDLASLAGVAGKEEKPPEVAAAPFPLANRKGSQSSSRPAAVQDPATFPPGVVYSAQAATLVSAAEEGAAFCPL